MSITHEAILRAKKDKRLRIDPEAMGWITSGTWAAYVGDTSAFEAEANIPHGKLRKMIAEYTEADRLPLRDLPDLHIPNKVTITKRTEYRGGCSGCECGDCDGWSGEPVEVEERQEELGQSVFESEDGRTFVLDPDLAQLLGGLTVSSSDPNGPYDKGCVCGFTGNGKLVVLVMPLTCEVREPERKDGAA